MGKVETIGILGLITGIGVVIYTVVTARKEPEVIIDMKETLQYYKDKGNEINDNAQETITKIDDTFKVIDEQVIEIKKKLVTVVDTATDLRTMVGGESQYDLQGMLDEIQNKMDTVIVEPVKTVYATATGGSGSRLR